jgi:hypothetical protein
MGMQPGRLETLEPPPLFEVNFFGWLQLELEPGFLDVNELAQRVSHDLSMRAPNPFDTDGEIRCKALLYILHRPREAFNADELSAVRATAYKWDPLSGWVTKPEDIYLVSSYMVLHRRIHVLMQPVTLQDLAKLR